MRCEAALELLFDFLDGELEGASNDEVAEHLRDARDVEAAAKLLKGQNEEVIDHLRSRMQRAS